MSIKRNILYCIASGFMLGVFIASFVQISSLLIVALLLIFVGILSVFITRNQFRGNNLSRIVGVLFSISIIFVLLGILRINQSESLFTKNPLRQFADTEVSAIGVVVTEPQRSDSLIKLTAKVVALESDNKITNLTPTKIILRTPFYNNIAYGDRVVVTGTIEKIKNFSDGNNNLFDYVSYLKKDGIAYEIRYPEIQIISHNYGNILVSSLLLIKNRFVKNIESNLGEPDGALVSGMIISGKQALDKTLTEDFTKVGIIHIVVLSGYNISLIAVLVLSLFSRFGRKIKFTLVIVLVICFVIMSGGSSTVVRASLMALVALYAKYSNRPTGAGRLLLFTGFIMVLWNPYLLAFDPSFQLSFLATFAIIFVSPIVRKKCSWMTEKWRLREIFSETLGVQIFLLPFLVYKMGLVSVVSLPVNILILPTIPFLMFFGAMVGFLGFIPFVAFPFALLCNIFVSHILFVTEMFVSLPFSSFSISNFPLTVTVIIYLVFFSYLIYLSYKKKQIYLEAIGSL